MLAILGYNIIITLSVLFTLTEHPLGLGIILILTASIIALVLTTSSASSWLPYLLLIIFIRGIIILFIYVASLASNEISSYPSHKPI